MRARHSCCINQLICMLIIRALYNFTLHKIGHAALFVCIKNTEKTVSTSFSGMEPSENSMFLLAEGQFHTNPL